MFASLDFVSTPGVWNDINQSGQLFGLNLEIDKAPIDSFLEAVYNLLA